MRRYALFAAATALLLFAVTWEVRASDEGFITPRIGIASGHGFCTGGAFPRISWPDPPPHGIHTWGSYCAERESSTGTVVTSPFVASSTLRLYLAGYTANPGESLQIERLSDHSKFVVQPSREPHEEWLLSEFSLPANWKGSLVRLVATDQSTGAGGWLAFSEPVIARKADINNAVLLASETIFHFILLLLPALAMCAWVVQKGVRNAITAGLVLLAGIGAAGYLVFWCYFIHPRLGYVVALVLPVAAVVFLAAIARKLDSNARQVLKSLMPPLALVGVAALLVLSMGFLYGGMQDPFRAASVRFSHHLPPDNTLPIWWQRGCAKVTCQSLCS
jgi:hypothetical protein